MWTEKLINPETPGVVDVDLGKGLRSEFPGVFVGCYLGISLMWTEKLHNPETPGVLRVMYLLNC